MMRSYKYIAVSILVMIGNVIDLRAQESGNKYLVEDRALAEQVRDAVISGQEGIDIMQQGWAKSVIDEAFKRYFLAAKPTTIIFEEASVVTLHGQLKAKDDEYRDLKNKYDRLKKSYDADVVKAKQEVIDGPLARKDQECIALQAEIQGLKSEAASLNAQINSLNAQINSLNAQIESLNEEAEIARKVIAKHAEKKKTVVSLYQSNANSSLEFVDAAAILSGVTDYEEYVALVELPIDPDLQKQIVFLKNLADAATFYKDAIAFMSSRFDQVRYDELLSEYSLLSKIINTLDPMQQTVFCKVGEALKGLKESQEHFVKSVLVYLEEQGLIPEPRVDEIKGDVNFKVELYTDGEHQDADRYRYNPYYKNLNRVLDMAYNGLRKMNVAEYEAYIKKLKENL